MMESLTTLPRRQLDLCQFEERIVFSAETQAFTPIDTTDLMGGSDSNDSLISVVEQNVDAQHGSAEPTQKAPLSSAETTAATLAFPGAAGFGAYAQGGRGGDVYHVTNVADSGPGSLRYGIESMTGPRTIVFDTSGTINLESRLTVSEPYLTIAGQTAPGDGITIANHTFQIHNTHDIIVRYLRVRAGDRDIANSNAATHDTFAVRWSHDVIVDHVSMSWGIDETFATTLAENVTVQWSIISESLSDSYHPKGVHGLASLSDRGSLSLHHNLYAHHDHRMPRLHAVSADVVNNVFYNWTSYPSSVGDSLGQAELSHVNFVNNVYIAGPSKIPRIDPHIVFWGRDASEIWADGNIVDANLDGVLDAVADFGLHPKSQTIMVDAPFEFPEIPTETAVDAYDQVLEFSGASIFRDEVDARVVEDVRSQTGSVINSQTEVGGYPIFESATAAIDTDQDGMPDEWENAFPNLDPNNPNDRNEDHDGDGYTNLEEFLNGMLETTVEIPNIGPSLDLSGEAEVTIGETFTLTVTEVNGSTKPETRQFDIDWNGDSRTDQTVKAPVGTQLEHVFTTAGDYTVQIQVTSTDGHAVSLAHQLRVVPSAPTPTDTNEIANDPVANPISLSPQVFLGETATLTLGTSQNAASKTFQTYRIDWDGDSRADQTVRIPMGSAVEHFYHQPGSYEVQVYEPEATTPAFVGTIQVVRPNYSLTIAGPSTTHLLGPEDFVISAKNPLHDGRVTIEVDWNSDTQIDETLLIEQNGHTLTHAFTTTDVQIITVFLTRDGERLETAQHEILVVPPPAQATLTESHQIVTYDYHVMRQFLDPNSDEDEDDAP